MNTNDLRRLQTGLGKASFYFGMAATVIGLLLWASANFGERRR